MNLIYPATIEYLQQQNERLSANHRDVVRIKRKTNDRLKIALAALQQIYDVCGDNAPETCDARMALAFVREVAGDAFNKATAPTRVMCDGCDGHECDERCAYPGAAETRS